MALAACTTARMSKLQDQADKPSCASQTPCCRHKQNPHASPMGLLVSATLRSSLKNNAAPLRAAHARLHALHGFDTMCQHDSLFRSAKVRDDNYQHIAEFIPKKHILQMMMTALSERAEMHFSAFKDYLARTQGKALPA